MVNDLNPLCSQWMAWHMSSFIVKAPPEILDSRWMLSHSKNYMQVGTSLYSVQSIDNITDNKNSNLKKICMMSSYNAETREIVAEKKTTNKSCLVFVHDITSPALESFQKFFRQTKKTFLIVKNISDAKTTDPSTLKLWLPDFVDNTPLPGNDVLYDFDFSDDEATTIINVNKNSHKSAPPNRAYPPKKTKRDCASAPATVAFPDEDVEWEDI